MEDQTHTKTPRSQTAMNGSYIVWTIVGVIVIIGLLIWILPRLT